MTSSCRAPAPATIPQRRGGGGGRPWQDPALGRCQGGTGSAAADSWPPCMRQEKNPPWRRGLSCLAYPWSPSLVGWNSLQSSHPGVISLPSSSTQTNVIKSPKPPWTLDQNHPNSGVHLSGTRFQNNLVLEVRALTPAGTSLFSHKGVSLPPFPAVMMTLSCLCPQPPARA